MDGLFVCMSQLLAKVYLKLFAPNNYTGCQKNATEGGGREVYTWLISRTAEPMNF